MFLQFDEDGNLVFEGPPSQGNEFTGNKARDNDGYGVFVDESSTGLNEFWGMVLKKNFLGGLERSERRLTHADIAETLDFPRRSFDG